MTNLCKSKSRFSLTVYLRLKRVLMYIKICSLVSWCCQSEFGGFRLDSVTLTLFSSAVSLWVSVSVAPCAAGSANLLSPYSEFQSKSNSHGSPREVQTKYFSRFPTNKDTKFEPKRNFLYFRLYIIHSKPKKLQSHLSQSRFESKSSGRVDVNVWTESFLRR